VSLGLGRQPEHENAAEQPAGGRQDQQQPAAQLGCALAWPRPGESCPSGISDNHCGIGVRDDPQREYSKGVF